MATETLLPNGLNGQTGTWGGTYSALGAVASHDGDATYMSLNYSEINAQSIFSLTNPGTVLTATQLTAEIAARWFGGGSCTVEFAVRIGGSDVASGTLGCNGSYQTATATATGSWNSGQLDGAELRVKMTSVSGTGQMRLTAGDVLVSDGATGPPATVEDEESRGRLAPAAWYCEG